MGTLVAGFILIHPSVQFKSVEGNALTADPNFADQWPHVCIEPVPIHAEIAGRIAQPQEARHDFHNGFLVSMHS